MSTALAEHMDSPGGKRLAYSVLHALTIASPTLHDDAAFLADKLGLKLKFDGN